MVGEIVQMLGVVAIIGTGAVYGTDFFCAVVLRAALQNVDDAALVSVTGQIHRFGDRRMPIPGAIGGISAATCSAVAFVGGLFIAAIAASTATVVLTTWLLVFARISAPVNKQLTSAAQKHDYRIDGRALQARWDRVINLRVSLQAIAMVALCIAVGAA
jgi:hypothetical protein